MRNLNEKWRQRHRVRGGLKWPFHWLDKALTKINIKMQRIELGGLLKWLFRLLDYAPTNINVKMQLICNYSTVRDIA